MKLAVILVLGLASALVEAAEPPGSFAWRADEGLAGASIRVPSEGDGTVEVADLAGRKAVRNIGASPYVYFDLTDGFEPAKAWVTVEFLDDGFGSLVLEYDAKQEPGAPLMASYRQADAAHGALRLSTGAWRRACFELAQPGFRNRENYHSDFRLSPRVAVASVRVSAAPPPEAELAALRSAGDLARRPPLVTVGAGVESTIGGQDQFDVTKSAAWKEQLLRELPVQKFLGATSHETYVTWAACQAKKDAWDFSHYDACVEAHETSGLRWVPFVILGPSYTLPDWYYASDERAGYRCLEHAQESDIQSLWAPKLSGRVEAFLAQFAKRYRDRGAIESVLLGITGNYGEAIYPATGNDWTADRHGKYHTHAGMWCGDPDAVADFQRWLKAKYVGLEKINAAWKTDLKAWEEARPAKNEKAAAARAWLDTVDWYRESMNRWIGLWMGVMTREMPGVPVYLCTGGHAPPEHGSEFGVQSKLAAKHRGGVRITNEGSDYPSNFSVTRWVASACRFYGTFFGFEPAGAVDEKGIVARIYNATASGAKQLHHYSDNLLGNPRTVEKWKQYGGLMKLRAPKVDVAFWYPNRAVDLRRGDVWRLLRDMREVCDYDIVDDCMIRDGALDRYRILVCVSGGPYEADILRRVGAWIRPDRALFLPDGPEHAVAAVEGDAPAAAGWKEMKGVQVLPSGAKFDAYWPALREKLAGEGILVTGIRGVYGTVFQDGSALLLNMTGAPQSVTVKGKAVAVPPVAIVEVP